MNSAIEIEKSPIADQKNPLIVESSEHPSSVELFSYGLCCAVQGLVGVLYFALVTLIPIAIRQGLLSHLL